MLLRELFEFGLGPFWLYRTLELFYARAAPAQWPNWMGECEKNKLKAGSNIPNMHENVLECMHTHTKHTKTNIAKYRK